MDIDDNSQCPICAKNFKINRIPLTLPCGHNCCQPCLQTLNSKQLNIKCPRDGSEFTIDLGSLSISRIYELIVQKSLNEIQEKKFVCSKHLNKSVKYVCLKHDKFLCHVCLWEHADHKDFTNVYDANDLLRDVNVLSQKLCEMKKELIDFENNLLKIKNKEICNSKQIKNILENTISFLKQPPFQYISSINEKFPLKIKPHLKFETEILTKKDEEKFIFSLFKHKINLRMLYRGSRENFSASKFHLYCDDKGPTIVLCKSKNGFIFGGYASKSWESPEKFKSVEAAASFLFSLTFRTKHEIYKNPLHALYFDKSYGPIFGGGHDLIIYDNASNTHNNYSSFGHTYQPPDLYGSETSKKYLAGSYKFEMQDYEVFTVETVEKVEK